MAQLLVAAGRAAAGYAADYAASTLINALAAPVEGPRLTSLQVQTSTDGAPMARLWGRARLAGQVIWAARIEEHAETSGAGKNGPRRTDYRYTLSFAIGLCEGPVDGMGRIWANGELLDQSGLNLRLMTGAEDQLPDPLITAIEGAEAPAFRGAAVLVLEDFPLDPYGGRIPNISVEVFRGAEPGGLESLAPAVNLIPGSGEFAYAVQPVMRQDGPGREQAENVNNRIGAADLVVSLNDLEARLPACRCVQIVIAWFGTDLRAGHCRIRPGVERRDKQTRPLVWSVAGESRDTAHLVSQLDGRPAYGGTPDDASVIEAIAELKARGFAVTLYPFILMDIAPGNGLPDPQGGAEQAAFPWRGRVTAEDAEAVAAFFGDGEDWGYRRFIRHCAALAQAAGGVDGFLIGSEMIGLTTSRDAAGGFPAVSCLVDLAADIRALLGPETRISYAADWTEYGGYRPDDGSGDVIFHLDPLWACDDIDAVAIDWYPPLGDWRSGAGHLDAADYASPHDPAYLAGQIEGGEGYDWYYASPADRAAQIRTPIEDTAHGEDWVFRVKDIRAFWSQAHHDRPGGVRSVDPTPWTPMSKPVWLTETGCPAVDKGANQPNVFFDPKSAESALPHHSDGGRDDLIQRRALEAQLAYWSDPARNPVSPLYGAPMIDTGLTALWAWDARPFPDFPARTDLWSDGANWRLGHWLNGRAGRSSLAWIVADLCEAAGVDVQLSALDGLAPGYLLDRPMSARAAIRPLAQLYGFDLAETGDGLVCAALHDQASVAIAGEALLADGRFDHHRARRGGMPSGLRFHFLDESRDDQPGHVHARNEAASSGETLSESMPLLLDPQTAARLAAARLSRLTGAADRITFTPGPALMALEAGDVVAARGDVWRIVERDGQGRVMAARAVPAGPVLSGGEPVSPGDPRRPPVRPELILLDAPALAGGETSGLLVAAASAPWPGRLHVVSDPAGPDQPVQLDRPAVAGRLTEPLAPGPRDRWDEAGMISIALDFGALASTDRLAVLNGAHLAAIETGEGWALLQFTEAELTGPASWRLTGLLRGRQGSPACGAPAGARFILLDDAVSALDLPADWLGETLHVFAGEAGLPQGHGAWAQSALAWTGEALRPLPPVHARLVRGPGGLAFSWIRQGRLDADAWAPADIPLGEAVEAYQFALMDGEAVLFEAETATPSFLLDPAEEAAVYGGPQTQFDVRIAQISALAGPGRALRTLLSA